MHLAQRLSEVRVKNSEFLFNFKMVATKFNIVNVGDFSKYVLTKLCFYVSTLTILIKFLPSI